MRIPRDSNLEPAVIASIRRYRRRALAVRLAAAAPVMLAVIAAMVIYLVKVTGTSKPAAPGTGSWVVLAVITGIYVVFVLLIGPEKIPLERTPDQGALKVFRDALEGVSIAAGIAPPELLVLDLPTANSLSLLHGGKAAVGVTGEALGAGLPGGCAEAMMAHELSHVLLRDVVVGTSRRRWAVVGLSLVAGAVLPFVFMVLAFGFGTWIVVGLFVWTAVIIALLRVLGSSIIRQDDLLADSIAAKMTGDPGALKEAIEKLDKMFLANKKPFAGGASYPTELFVYEVRPEMDVKAMQEQKIFDEDSLEAQDVTDDNMRSALRRKAAFPRESTADRIENLEAIERGHWKAFE